ncbi:MAG: DNA-binding response regulator [Micrococcales bacterium]|nr:DNA-binding response regulator [Micrococcales bacterium]
MYQRSVLVVEDEPFVRGLVADKLKGDGFTVELASSAAEARKITANKDIDIVVLDIDLGSGPSGLDLGLALHKMHPEIALVFLTHVPEPRIFGVDVKSMPKNAAYLLKQRLADPNLLKDAIEAALRDKVGPEFRDDLRPTHPLMNVSKTQLDVLRMIAKGYSNQQIAEARGTTLRAVENLVNRAIAAAGIDVKSKTSARVIAVREFIRVAGLPE